MFKEGESPPSSSLFYEMMIDVLIISSGKSCHDNPKDRSFSSKGQTRQKRLEKENISPYKTQNLSKTNISNGPCDNQFIDK